MLGSIADMETGDGLGFGSAYCVSKAALNMLTKMFASQLAKENFIVYSSHPGWVKTELVIKKTIFLNPIMKSIFLTTY